MNDLEVLATLAGSSLSGVTGPRLPVVLGGAAATAGMAVIALAHDPWTLLVGVFLAGTSPGLAYPPLSDAVLRLVEAPLQSRSYAIINSGTSVGVVIAGPLALWAGADWRLAWLAFAGFAFLAMLWNAWLLPTGAYGGSLETLPRLSPAWFRREGAGQLFFSAITFGSVTSVYWTFAVDLITAESQASQPMIKLFWVVIGIAGFAGAAAGDLVRRHGLKSVFRCGALAIPVSILLLSTRPWGAPGIIASGALFGGAFILVTGLFGIWSMHVFQDRPSAGFGATFFLISAGQMVGPAVGGLWAELFGLPATFVATLVLSGAAAFLVPRKDFHTILA